MPDNLNAFDGGRKIQSCWNIAFTLPSLASLQTHKQDRNARPRLCLAHSNNSVG